MSIWWQKHMQDQKEIFTLFTYVVACSIKKWTILDLDEELGHDHTEMRRQGNHWFSMVWCAWRVLLSCAERHVFLAVCRRVLKLLLPFCCCPAFPGVFQAMGCNSVWSGPLRCQPTATDIAKLDKRRGLLVECGKAECLSFISILCYLFAYLKCFFFSGFQHFSLAVAPQDNGPQRPLDCLNTQNTLALQRTGVYTENLPLSMKYNLIFFVKMWCD